MKSKAENHAAAAAIPPSLTATLLADDRKVVLATDSLRLLEFRVQKSPGFKGAALRTGLGVLKSARPDILTHAVRHLLPTFITALEPFYTEYRSVAIRTTQSAGDFSAFLLYRRERVMEAIVDAADELADSSSNVGVRSFYSRSRGTIGKGIAAALPTLTHRIDAELQRTAV